jgi:hypothetical protein
VERDNWQAVGSTVIIFQLPQNAGISRLAEDICFSKGAQLCGVIYFFICLFSLVPLHVETMPDSESYQQFSIRTIIFLLFIFDRNNNNNCYLLGTAVAQRLRYCTTNQKVAGSIPYDVMEFFIEINPSDRTMTLGSTQPLTEMSTRNISWE